MVRFGQFKSPFGYEQLYGDPRLPTLERTLVNDRLTFGRQIGFQVFGDTIGGLGFDSTPATADRDNLFAGKRDGREFDLQLKAPGARFEVWAEWIEGHFEPLNARPRPELDAEG